MKHADAVLVICTTLAVATGCSRHGQDTPVQTLDWRTSPLDLDLRGMDGSRYRFDCPPGKPVPELVTGTGIYTDASSICSAAVHAGAIDPQHGGEVEIQILPGQSRYQGSTQNFVHSRGFPHPWSGSFAVLGGPGPPASR